MVNKEEIIEYLKGYIDEKFSEMWESFTESGELTPVVELHFRDDSGKYFGHPLPGAHMFFESEMTKNLLKPFIQKVCKWIQTGEGAPGADTDLVAVVVISDVFYAGYDMKDMTDEQREEFKRNHPRPSQDPNRTEAIMFACSIKEGSLTKVFPYTRNGKIVFGEPRIMEGEKEEGRMISLFPE